MSTIVALLAAVAVLAPVGFVLYRRTLTREAAEAELETVAAARPKWPLLEAVDRSMSKPCPEPCARECECSGPYEEDTAPTWVPTEGSAEE